MFFLVNTQAEEEQLYKTELLYLYLLRIYEIFSIFHQFIVKIQNGFARASILGEHLPMAASDIFLLKFWNKTVLIMIIFIEK